MNVNLNVNRLVSLALALLITATEWTALSDMASLLEPQPLVSVPTDAAAPAPLPEIVVTGHRGH